MMRMKQMIAGLTACGMAAAVGVFAPAQASDGTSDGSPELTSTAGTPAAATLPEIEMVCSEGQVDINHASLLELMAVLGVDLPVVDRLVSYRPYLAPSDLGVVEGIGPGNLRAILAADTTCATPTQFPPPAAEACTTSEQVDLAAASERELMDELDISKPRARRIIAARPYASLSHVTPERVPGVGKGNLDNIVAISCLTPTPIRTATQSFRYAYQTQTTTVSRDGYVLEVPAGVIDGSGAWAEVTPIDVSADWPGDPYPSAEFHIHGPWSDGTQTVLVTVPEALYADEIAGDDWTPYLVHHFGDGTGENVTGSRISVDATTGAVTGVVSQLSVIDWAMHKGNWLIEPSYGLFFGNRFPAPECDRPWAEVAGTNQWTSEGHDVYLTNSIMDLPGNDVPFSGIPVKHCVGTTGDIDADLTLRNATGTIFKINYLSGDATVIEPPAPADLITWALTSFETGDFTYVGPGDDAHIVVPPESAGRVEIGSDPLRSVTRVALDGALGLLVERLGPAKTDPTFREAFVAIVSCAYDTWKAFGAPSSLNRARDFAVALLGCIDYDTLLLSLSVRALALEDAGVLSSGQVADVTGTLKRLGELVKWLEYGGMAINAIEGFTWSIDQPLLIEHFVPPPTVDDLGRSLHPACLLQDGYGWFIDMNCQNTNYNDISTPPTGSGGGTSGLPAGIIARNVLGQAWFINTDDQVAQPIDDPGTYLCLAKHYVVDWDANHGHYLEQHTFDPTAATCDDTLAATRNISPATLSPKARVLREPDQTAWVILGDERQHITSGEDFFCWVNQQYRSNIELHVWDQVTSAELSQWLESPPGSYATNCGDPENPEF